MSDSWFHGCSATAHGIRAWQAPVPHDVAKHRVLRFEVSSALFDRNHARRARTRSVRFHNQHRCRWLGLDEPDNVVRRLS